MQSGTRLRAACVAAATSIVLPIIALAHSEWPDGPHKQWLESLQRPDNHLNPSRKLDPKSLFCCGVADEAPQHAADVFATRTWHLCAV
jgi:hypothetical protein